MIMGFENKDYLKYPITGDNNESSPLKLDNYEEDIVDIHEREENNQLNTEKNETKNITEVEKNQTKVETKKELTYITIAIRGKKELLDAFSENSKKYYNSEQIIYEVKSDLQNELRKKDKFEGNELIKLYEKYNLILDERINEEKKKIEKQINSYLEDEKKLLKKEILTGIIPEYIDEATNLFNEIFNEINTIGKIFIINYQNEDLKNIILYYQKDLSIDNIEEIDILKNKFNNININENIINEIKIIIEYIKNESLANIKDYLDLLRKLSKLKDIDIDKNQEKIEIEWSKMQKRKHYIQIKNGYTGLINNISEKYKNNSININNKLKEIIGNIFYGKNILQKIREYSKKYNIFMIIKKENGLENILEELIKNIGLRENILFKKENIKNPKLKLNTNEHDSKYLNEIKSTLNKATPFLDGNKLIKLKEELNEVYKIGINTENPTEYWNNYTIVKKYEIKQPISNNKDEKNELKALQNALNIKRIEFMQKDLIKRDHNGFMKIKEKIGGKNYKTFIINLKNIYGVNKNIEEYLVDYEKEYGKIIDSAINSQIEKDKGKKFGILNIFGNINNIKNNLYRIITIESMGNIFTSNGGISSALGILQKLEVNYKQFQINPFNIKDSIESFFESIVIVFNNYFDGELLKKLNSEEKTKIAILVHFLGEGKTKKILEKVNWNVNKITNTKEGKKTLESISDNNPKIKAFINYSIINKNKNNIIEKEKKELDKKLKEERKEHRIGDKNEDYLEKLMT